MITDLTRQYNLHFIPVDMGPAITRINEVLTTSCDVIQSCACPDSFSWAGATKLMVDVLPEWLRLFLKHKRDEKEAKLAIRPFNPSFPKIMPVMGMQVSSLIG